MDYNESLKVSQKKKETATDWPTVDFIVYGYCFFMSYLRNFAKASQAFSLIFSSRSPII